MIRDDIKQIVVELLPELNRITTDYMVRSGLQQNSDLVQSSKFMETENGMALEANYYFQFVDEGRRPFVKKVPIRALLEFIKDRGLIPRGGQSINSLAFAIQTSIYRQGIQPKNFFDKVIDATSDVTEEVLADELSQDIADQIMAKMLESQYAKQV
jgi:hypothetical protein